MTPLPRLLLLTDRAQLRLGRGLVATVRECADAGLSHVVVRELDLAPGARSALVRTLAGVPGLTVISSRIPDRHAHGLHLPSVAAPATPAPVVPAAPAAPARQRPCNAVSWTDNRPSDPSCRSTTPRYMPEGQGQGWGRSCHSTEEVRRAAEAGADYVTLSPFAATPSKPGYGPPLAREDFAVGAVPVFALGGITVANAASAREAGAHGVAVMGEVMRSADPAGTVARLLEVLQ